MSTQNTSVVICGAGPAGLTLAHLLGDEGVDVIVLEALAATVTEPRAIAIDGESLRTLQSVDLVNGFADEMLPGVSADYVNAQGERLFELGGADEQPYGYPMVNSFDQPALDSYLAAQLAGQKSVQLLFNHTLEKFEQAAHGVAVFATDGTGAAVEIQADYLVGCDGGRSTIRRLLDIAMQGESNPQPWLVIDTIDPYMDEDAICRFYCDPARPGMTIKKRHQERRWEWMLMPGEEPETLLEDGVIRAIIAPYTNAERVNIYRKRVYNFHAILADQFQRGRVFLAGDAAHMTPPFAGQGLNSGFRDVRNLSWKLAGVVKGQFSPAILSSYEQERREHAAALIDTALKLGRQIQPTDPEQAAERDAMFAEMRHTPGALEDFQRDILKATTERVLVEGLILDPAMDNLNGRLLVQPRLNSVPSRNFLLDEALGSGFSIVGYNCDPALVIEAEDLVWWRARDTRLITINARGVMPQDHWLEDAYGDLGRWLGGRQSCLLLIRPDRFCMAAFDADSAAEQLGQARLLLENSQ